MLYLLFPEDLPMNKLELIDAVRDETQIKKSEAAAVVNLFLKIGGSSLRLTLVKKCQRSNVDLTLNTQLTATTY